MSPSLGPCFPPLPVASGLQGTATRHTRVPAVPARTRPAGKVDFSPAIAPQRLKWRWRSSGLWDPVCLQASSQTQYSSLWWETTYTLKIGGCWSFSTLTVSLQLTSQYPTFIFPLTTQSSNTLASVLASYLAYWLQTYHHVPSNHLIFYLG